MHLDGIVVGGWMFAGVSISRASVTSTGLIVGLVEYRHTCRSAVSWRGDWGANSGLLCGLRRVCVGGCDTYPCRLLRTPFCG